MSFPGQIHHPHPPNAGVPPNAHLIARSSPDDPTRPYLPPGLELVQAHWFVRHGERAPVRQRLAGVADIPPVFALCAVGREFRTAVLSLGNGTFPGGPPPHATQGAGKETMMDVRRLTEDVGDSARGYAGGLADCYWGELTDLGRRSTLSLGTALRALYVPLGFLPPTLSSDTAEQVSFRSTNMPRTIESLHQVVEGLWPASHRESGFKVDFRLRGWQDEDLYPNTSCRRLRQLDLASIANAAKTYNPSLAALDPVLAPILDGPLRIDSAPRASGVLDTVFVCKAHGIKVPPELEDLKTLRTLEDAIVHEWFDGYSNPEYRRLAMGRLLGSLHATLDAKLRDPHEKREKTRLHVYSCHDTSVAGILNALDAFDKRWPPFTSHLAVELLRAPAAPSALSRLLPGAAVAPAPPAQHYVRLRYNARPLVLPACAPAGKHLPGSEGEVCTWEAFTDAVRAVECTQAEWRGWCGSRNE
ncbi:hypothetical protein JCM3770_000022 [Rhodotorula araucariae]